MVTRGLPRSQPSKSDSPSSSCALHSVSHTGISAEARSCVHKLDSASSTAEWMGGVFIFDNCIAKILILVLCLRYRKTDFAHRCLALACTLVANTSFPARTPRRSGQPLADSVAYREIVPMRLIIVGYPIPRCYGKMVTTNFTTSPRDSRTGPH